jgi:DNA repair exonuclease SbcCD ATPase subunit
MRLQGLSISGFRGFSEAADIALDADAVILIGANGSGKTSFFDAILWALAGQVPRLGTKPESVVSRYSPSGEARVELTLIKPGGGVLTVARRWSGEMTLVVSDSEGQRVGPSAEGYLLEQMWPDARAASDPSGAVARAITRGVYLQQDLLREFIEADSEQDRFEVISEIVGAGRVNELQKQLESAKTSWTRSTNVLDTELVPARRRRATVTQRLDRLGESPAESDIALDWAAWIDQAGQVISVPSIAADSPEAARVLDNALKELQARQLGIERRITNLRRLLEQLNNRPPAHADAEPLRAQLAEAEAATTQARMRLQAAQEQAAAQRRRQVGAQEREEELRALAQLALRNLSERCPVCGQEHDLPATRARLEKFIQGTQQDAEAAIDVKGPTGELERAEQKLAQISMMVQAAEHAERSFKSWQESVEQLRSEAEISSGVEVSEAATANLASLQEQQETIRTLRSRGDALAIALARAGEIAQRAELERELASINHEISAREGELVARAATGDLAGEILNALRGASSDIVAGELERMEPVLQRVYATIDPHPAFRAVHFLTRTVRGRGRLWTSIDDRAANVSVDEPETVLSSSQLNVLAVSAFLALNLGVETLPLRVAALDDPLQSLDNVNLLGLVDLLRRVKDRRQVLVSTHDPRLGDLLARKLRPVAEGERVRLIEFEGWTRQGPILLQEEIPMDPKPLRLVA